MYIHARFFSAANHGLKRMSMQMKRMFPGIHIIQHNLHDLPLLQHERNRVLAIYGRIRGLSSGSESGVEGRNYGTDVGEVVEEGVVGAVAKIIHFHVEVEGVVDVLEEGFAVVGDQGEVVKGGKGVDEGGSGEGRCGVVDEPACDVGVEAFGVGVEEIL